MGTADWFRTNASHGIAAGQNTESDADRKFMGTDMRNRRGQP
jgi:hypothetical protein